MMNGASFYEWENKCIFYMLGITRLARVCDWVPNPLNISQRQSLFNLTIYVVTLNHDNSGDTIYEIIRFFPVERLDKVANGVSPFRSYITHHTQHTRTPLTI